MFFGAFFVPHVGAAIRSFIDASVNPKSNIHINTADYDLYKIGEYDSVTGEIFALTEYELLCTGKSLTVISDSQD